MDATSFYLVLVLYVQFPLKPEFGLKELQFSILTTTYFAEITHITTVPATLEKQPTELLISSRVIPTGNFTDS